METIVFGGGCFWCTEAVFLMIKGGELVEPGYAGDPKAEGVKIVSPPARFASPELLQFFLASHDPTQADGQGNDVGPQYRSAVFYTTERQKQMAEHYIRNLGYGFVKPIVTSLEPLQTFYKAEDYHQKYYEAHKDAPYCQLVIAPKVEKVETKFKNLLK